VAQGNCTERYREELRNNTSQVSILKTQLAKGAATLVYSAKDEEHNDAVVLLAFLK
jgi:uncharacterized protein YeaO (DUF488 family)